VFVYCYFTVNSNKSIKGVEQNTLVLTTNSYFLVCFYDFLASKSGEYDSWMTGGLGFVGDCERAAG